MTFGASVLTAGPVKKVLGGEGKIVAKLIFVNGAVKWAFIDKDRAVLFELGLFMGRLGREKTYFVVLYGSDMHLPSDLLGLVAGRYHANRSDDNWRAAVGPACDDIRRALEKAAAQSQRDQLRKPPDPLEEGQLGCRSM